MINDIVAVEFVTQSTKGDVYVELGFVPDFAFLIADHGKTSPDIYVWFNVARWAGWAADLALLITGTTGVVTRDTADTIIAYAGGDLVSTAETTASSPKHVDLTGTAAAAGHITASGLQVQSEILTNSARNMLVAFRVNV